MLKIYNQMETIQHQIFKTIGNGLLDYIPGDKFYEVFNIEDADIILIGSGIGSDGNLSVNLGGFSHGTFRDLENSLPLYNALAEKHRILWVDVTGPSIYRDPDPLNSEITGLRETDIVISPVTVGNRLNTFTNVWHIEKSIFRPRERFQIVKGSVIISYDNIDPNHFMNKDVDIEAITLGLMDVISHLYITKTHALSPELEDLLGNSLSKVSVHSLNYPQEVARHLAQAEFVLSTYEDIGIECMGIEGGLSGCQPIYPDTEFYRDAFDNTGVAFYDTQDRVTSLQAIIKGGSKFDKETTEAFRTKFSAEDTLPKFWEHVYELYSD